MSENRFVAEQVDVVNEDETEVWDIVFDTENTYAFMVRDTDTASGLCDLLNEQQELIEELQASDEMGWKRAEMFEKKCPKELHNKKMYIKRLEYKVQKFKEENEQLKKQLEHYAKVEAMNGDEKNERLR